MSETPGVDDTVARLEHTFKWCRWSLEELTDAEYFWEPHERCWGIRARNADVDSRGWGTGDWICEDVFPPPDPPPITTIGWRAVHLAGWTEVYRDWTFGDQNLGLPDLSVPGSAAEAVTWVHQAQDRFLESVRALDDENLEALGRAHYGAELPVRWLIWAVLVEHIHHSAEISALRDLHRGHGRPQA